MKKISWKIKDNQKPVSAHYHIIDENNKCQVVDLPFTVKKNIVTAILPDDVKFLIEPKLVVEINQEKMTNQKADEIFNLVSQKINSIVWK